MSIDAKLLARALRAAAAALDGPTPAATANAPRARGEAREPKPAFEVRAGGKACEACGRAIERGARVVWGSDKGRMRHEACADGAAPAEPARAPLARASGDGLVPPADDFASSDFGGGDDDEIPF